MAAKPCLFLTLMFMIAVASTATARLLKKPEDSPSLSTSTTPSPTSLITSPTSLINRLKLDEETGYCWDSLVQLQHCTGELIMFFLNGETYVGPGCCRAIRTVGRICWPNMLGVLGFTAQEGDMLQGYCDDNDHDNNCDDHSPPSPHMIPSVIFKSTNARSSNP